MYKTQVFTSHRGYEKRNIDWSQPMMEFNAAYGIRTDSQILDVINFFNARQGRLFGFRFKNWCNYNIKDAPIATGDGFSKRLPIYKFYGFSGTHHYKRLRKIVRGSVQGVQVGIDPVEEGSDFRIDYDAGEIVFNEPVGYGVLVRAVNLEFDEPVHFTEDSVENVIDQYNNNSLSRLDLISVRGDFSAGSAFSPDLSEKGKPDSLYGRTFLLLNFDGTHGSTDTTDHSPIQNPVTMYGSAQLSTDSFRHGNASLDVGASGYVSAIGAPYRFGVQPFTVEAFAQRPDEGNEVQPLIGLWEEGASQRSWILRYRVETKRVEFVISSNGIDEHVILSHPWETSKDFFDHLSVDRMSGGWYVLRINGKVKQSSRDFRTLYGSTAPLTVGNVVNPQGDEGSFRGKIDSIRVTNGHSRYPGFEESDIPAPYGVS